MLELRLWWLLACRTSPLSMCHRWGIAVTRLLNHHDPVHVSISFRPASAFTPSVFRLATVSARSSERFLTRRSFLVVLPVSFSSASAAISGAGTSGPMAAELEAACERASRRRGREAEGWRPRSGCCSSRSSGHSRWPRSAIQERALERPINVLLSQTEAFVERARKRFRATMPRASN